MGSRWCWFVFSFLMYQQLVSGDGFTKLTIKQKPGNVSELMTFELNKDIEHVLVFSSKDVYPFRITATSNASVHNPVVIVVRQEKEVLSWQVPLVLESTKRDWKLKFNDTSRTLCHNDMPTIVKTKTYARRYMQLSQEFLVAISTSSRKNVTATLSVEPEKDFYIENEKKYMLAVSPSNPKYYYYKFPNNKTDMVMLEITSGDDVCLTVSVQEASCPVFDLETDITYDGRYQTINRRGGMSIRRSDFPEGFFLVFVAKVDNFECSIEHSVLPNPWNSRFRIVNRTSTVEFQLHKGISSKGYGIAVVITLGAIGGFWLVAIITVLSFTRWGMISKIKKFRKNRDLTDAAENGQEEEAPVVLSKEERRKILLQQQLTVDVFARDNITDRRRGYNYLWHILSIAIFYSIPVVQLVFTYQRVVNQTGNQDMCYYNFLCANPALGLSDFNHIFSNIGYVLIGFLFLGLVSYRHARLPSLTTGIPYHFGVFYAMGIALIIEGLLSACYHICPSQSNYQFDTSFMYVMAVLCLIKLYQNRHPDINATAYATFTVLGIAIFLAMVGILNGSLAVWIIFVLVYSMLCIYISFKIYFLSFVWEGFVEFKDAFVEDGLKLKILAPIRRSHFILLLIANIINYAMLITGLCLYENGVTDFGTFLLGLLMANAVLYAVFYTGMKLVNGERICAEAILYGLLGIASWAAATVFFLDPATLWTVTPAESRQWNQECIVLDFYDKHDVWHLLSAPALYFSFMFLLCLDDDLVNKKRKDLAVF